MADVVQEIKTSIAGTIVGLFPTKTESKYVWDLARNQNQKNANLYAIRPGEIFRVPGVTKNVTVDQTFSVILSTSYNDSPSNDQDLQDKIFDLFDNVTDLWGEIFRSKCGNARVLVVSDFESDRPEINDKDRVVSIETRFTVKYRMEVV